MSDLIPVAKDGDYLEVHPTCLAGHKAAGWKECEKRDLPAAETPAPRKSKQDKE